MSGVGELEVGSMVEGRRNGGVGVKYLPSPNRNVSIFQTKQYNYNTWKLTGEVNSFHLKSSLIFFNMPCKCISRKAVCVRMFVVCVRMSIQWKIPERLLLVRAS